MSIKVINAYNYSKMRTDMSLTSESDKVYAIIRGSKYKTSVLNNSSQQRYGKIEETILILNGSNNILLITPLVIEYAHLSNKIVLKRTHIRIVIDFDRKNPNKAIWSLNKCTFSINDITYANWIDRLVSLNKIDMNSVYLSSSTNTKWLSIIDMKNLIDLSIVDKDISLYNTSRVNLMDVLYDIANLFDLLNNIASNSEKVADSSKI